MIMVDQPQFELFGFWRTSATYRVRVALNLKGMSAQEHSVNLDAGEQRSEAFLKINPLGAIPALVEKGHAPLTQSLAILEFLDEVTPEPPLLPADPYGRARVRSIGAALAADNPSSNRAPGQKVSYDNRRVRRRRLARMADQLVHHRPQVGRGATCH